MNLEEIKKELERIREQLHEYRAITNPILWADKENLIMQGIESSIKKAVEERNVNAVVWSSGDRIEFHSSKPHCNSCKDDKEQGYGDDILGCCCTHIDEAKERKLDR